MTIIAVIRRSCKWIQQSVGELLMLLQMPAIVILQRSKVAQDILSFHFSYPYPCFQSLLFNQLLVMWSVLI
jgi:hypothetical protein